MNLLLFPLRGPGSWVLSAWTLIAAAALAALEAAALAGGMVASAAGLLLAPVLYVGLGSVMLWGQAGLERISRGHTTLPTHDLSDLNPIRQADALFLSMLVGGAVLLQGTSAWAWWLIPVLTPVWALLNSERSIRVALSPTLWVQLLRGLGVVAVPAATLTTLALGGLGYALAESLRWPFLALAGYGYVLAACLLGRCLYARRNELDWVTELSPEQSRAAEIAERQIAINALLDSAHRLCEIGRVADAARAVEAFLTDRHDELDAVMHAQLLRFQDQRLMLEHAVRYLERQVAAGHGAIAWGLLKTGLTADDRFRPLTDRALLDAAAFAIGPDATMADRVLADFERAYPDSTLGAAALFLRARLQTEELHNDDAAKSLLQAIQGRHPGFARTEAFKVLWTQVFRG